MRTRDQVKNTRLCRMADEPEDSSAWVWTPNPSEPGRTAYAVMLVEVAVRGRA